MAGKPLDKIEAKEFYDSFGSKQDKQGWYEDNAVNLLLNAGRFSSAGSVLEFGCGTGRIAEKLLAQYLPETTTYLGLDISPTMIELSRERLERFAPRAQVMLLDEDTLPSLEGRRYGRFLSTYVFDLLSDDEIQRTLGWAYELLDEDGLLCLTGITKGRNWFSRLVMGGWKLAFLIRPKLVGGCRPVVIRDHLANEPWHIIESKVVAQWGVASEVLVAKKKRPFENYGQAKP